MTSNPRITLIRFAFVLVIVALISFIAFKSGPPAESTVSVTQKLTHGGSPSVSRQVDYPPGRFPRDDFVKFVEAFVGNHNRTSTLECSFSHPVDLKLDIAKTDGAIDSSAILPVKLTLSTAPSGAVVLSNGFGQTLATGPTTNRGIISNATFDLLRQTWIDCVSTDGK